MASRREPKIKEIIIDGVRALVLDMGDVVVCDRCNRDRTNSHRSGGAIVSGQALCPKCFRACVSRLKGVPAADISICPRNVSFADHVRQFRLKTESGLGVLFKAKVLAP